MKYLTKLGIFLALLGCVCGLVLCTANKCDFGTWDIPAFIGGIAFCVLCLSWRGILTFLDDRFDIEYSKDKGLTVRENENKDKIGLK